MEERRRFKRMDVSLNGRFMVEDTKEYPCEVFNMSPGGHGGESTFLSARRRTGHLLY